MSRRKNGATAGSATVLLGYFLLIITGLYQGTLLSKLLIVNKEAPFRSLEAFLGKVGSGELQFATTSVENALFERINASSSYEFRLAIGLCILSQHQSIHCYAPPHHHPSAASFSNFIAITITFLVIYHLFLNPSLHATTTTQNTTTINDSN